MIGTLGYMILRALVLVGLLVMWTGCGKRPAVIFDQPEMAQSGYYDKAWVDPVIILSDSLFTFIRAERVDSFYVDQPPDPEEEIAPSIMFHIRQETCFTTINLLDDQSRVVRPLLARNLSRGYYRVTCNVSRLSPETSSTGIYFLKAVYCDFQVVERLTVR
jgi:hypothetical protein